MDRYEQGLNEAQQAAVNHVSGPLLVIAGAGSGKTRVITHRVAALIGRGYARPDEVLAVTFTNKAAAEMRDRIFALVGDDARRVCVETFHAYCVRELRRFADRLGWRKDFSIASESDARALIRRAAEDIALGGDGLSFDIVRDCFSRMKNNGADDTLEGEPELPDTLAASARGEKYRQHLRLIFDRYQSALRAANSMDFDDLLVMTLRLWKSCPDVLGDARRRARFILVDEYQDTNRVQFELIRTLAGPDRNVCVVGDDDQAIYGWRGADVRNILQFERHFPGARVITLDVNYRSTGMIIEAANHVVAHNRQRREKTLRAVNAPGRKLDLFTVADEDHEALEAIRWLLHIRRKTGAPWSAFAMLYRTGAQSRPLEMALRAADIPYEVFGSQDFFERIEVRDIIAYLRLMVNPRDEQAFLRVVNVPRRGIGDATLELAHRICQQENKTLGMALAAILERDAAPRPAVAGIRSFLRIVMTYRKRFHEAGRNLAGVARDLVAEIGYLEALRSSSRSQAQYDTRAEGVNLVLNAIEKYAATAEFPSLRDFLDRTHLNADRFGNGRDDRSVDAVSLMTAHSAKGLEFPYVFILGMEEGLFPHARSVEENGIEEERRLFYVALTRGMKMVSLFHALERRQGEKTRPAEPSRFLAEIPEALLVRQARVAPPARAKAPAADRNGKRRRQS
ncbi:MAG TPA: UvrD-helicase domain-containing protein [Candidatus Hydrogenedentes bacterium]|nr:UvrD-helicase domain-containing protein [Candidatus Hydrogenedentota bacterium]HOK89997.1 UvrD-helicase domain-containing protein [Candidatus Hydrogenedentota bacterium]